MSIHLTPLEVCVRLVGPLEAIGAICGVHPKSPYQWRRAAEGRLPGDIPSAVHMRALLNWAQDNGVLLTADMLVKGADEDTITALCAQSQGRAA